MKKILIPILLSLLFPFIAYANIAVSWNATSTDNGFIQPTALNGIIDAIKIPYFVTTSTIATSTAANGINLSGGCFSIGGSCLSLGGNPGGSVGQVQYNASGAFGGVSTTTLLAGTGTSFSGGTPVIIGSTPITINSAISSVSNSDGTLTISPTTGAVIASLNLGHANSWSGLQTFTNSSTTLGSFGYASSTNLFAGNFTLSTTSAGCASFTSGGALFSTGVSCGTGSGGGGSDPFVHFNGVNSATTTSIAVGTTTASNYQFTSASSTAPQIALSSGSGLQWTDRNAGGNYYMSTTTADGTATTTVPAISINGTTGKTGFGVANPTQQFNFNTGSSGASFSSNGTTADTIGILDVYKHNASSGDIIFSVGSENRTNQFVVKDQQAISLTAFGADLGSLHVGNSGGLSSISSVNSTGQRIDFDNATNNNMLLNTTLTNAAIILSPQNTIVATASSTQGFLVSANLGVGTTSPWRTFSLVGTVAMNGLGSGTSKDAVCIDATTKEVVDAGATTCLSSSKYTKDITGHITPEVADYIVERMNTITFNYKGQDNQHYGFVAEEVAQIDQEVKAKFGVDAQLAEYAQEDTTLDGHSFKKGDPISVEYTNYTAVLNVYITSHQKKQHEINIFLFCAIGILTLGMIGMVGLYLKKK